MSTPCKDTSQKIFVVTQLKDDPKVADYIEENEAVILELVHLLETAASKTIL